MGRPETSVRPSCPACGCCREYGLCVLEAEFQQELCGFKLVPGGAAGRVAFHDGDDAADDAPAALSFVKDDALYGFPQPLVGFLLWRCMLQLSDHNEVMIAQNVWVVKRK